MDGKEMKPPTKRIFSAVCIVLFCALLFSGCVTRGPWLNNLDTKTFYANIKADASADYGKKAAEYDGRIYYLSAENGTQGVYSMRPDGSDVQLEFAAEDIRALTVKDDGFYDAEFAGVEENINGSYRSFHLYYRAAPDDAPTDLAAQAEYEEALDGGMIWDFYISEKGYIYIRIAEAVVYGEGIRQKLVCLIDGKLLPEANYSCNVDDQAVAETADGTILMRLYQYSRQYIAVYPGYAHESMDYQILGSDNVCLYDADVAQVVLPTEKLTKWSGERCICTSLLPIFGLDKYKTGRVGDYWILRICDGRMLLAAENSLSVYDMASERGSVLAEFPTTESIYATYDTGGDVLLLTRGFRKSGWLREGFRSVFGIDELKGERLYRADPETGERTRILSLKSGEAFLYVDDSRAAVASGETVLVYDISGDTPVTVKTIELGHEIVDCANKVDAAGNWLFLYRFNEETGRDELLEKIDIG